MNSNKGSKFGSNFLNKFRKPVSINTQSSTSNISVTHIVSLILIIIVIYLVVVLIYYFLYSCKKKKSLYEYITSFSLDPCDKNGEMSIDLNPISLIESTLKDDEVFHVSNQDYTFDQAKCKCEAYGAKLATREQIMKAYNNGAEWCSYGWSEGQNAYYPTQKCTWDKMQRGPKRNRNDCGMPGINGGFFSNPKLRLGVNCYGTKPAGEVVKLKKPECKEGEFCKREENYNASNKLPTDNIAPFNSEKWSGL